MITRKGWRPNEGGDTNLKCDLWRASLSRQVYLVRWKSVPLFLVFHTGFAWSEYLKSERAYKLRVTF